MKIELPDIITTVRRARLELEYEGQDISRDIEGMVLSFSFTDHAHGQADDLELVLENRAGLWGGDWWPAEGDRVKAVIVCTNWDEPLDRIEMPCGEFSVDGICLTGPPDTVVIRGVSSFTDSAIRQETKTKAWENTNLGAIAQEIAGTHGLELYWDAENVDLKRVDQRDESDLAFLKRLCEENGYNIKVSGSLLIIYEGDTYEGGDAAVTLIRGENRILNYEINSAAHGTYRACEVSYQDPKTKKVQSYTFTPENAPEQGPILKINEKVDSQAEAEKRAKAALREKNKGQVTGSFELTGTPALAGGTVIEIEGFHSFDGNYLVEEARHTLDRGAGYKTSVSFRNLLEY